nr:putative ORF2 [Fur seal faeces associated circular DNA virus]
MDGIGSLILQILQRHALVMVLRMVRMDGNVSNLLITILLLFLGVLDMLKSSLLIRTIRILVLNKVKLQPIIRCCLILLWILKWVVAICLLILMIELLQNVNIGWVLVSVLLMVILRHLNLFLKHLL